MKAGFEMGETWAPGARTCAGRWEGEVRDRSNKGEGDTVVWTAKDRGEGVSKSSSTTLVASALNEKCQGL